MKIGRKRRGFPSNYTSFMLGVWNCLCPHFWVLRRKKRRHFHIKQEWKMDNKLKIRFSKIHRKGGFKGSWTSKFLGKKKGSRSLSTCCNMRMRSHTKAFKAPHYVTIWWVAIRKVVLNLVNVNPSSSFQKAVLCSTFAVELQYYRMEKKLFSVFSEVMVKWDVEIHREGMNWSLLWHMM